MSVTPEVAADASVARPPLPSTQGGATRTIPDLPTVLERDRRAGVERVIELARWIVLIFAAVSVNFPGETTKNRPEVNLLLALWAIFTLATTLALLVNRIPTRRLQYAMLALDIVIASGLVYLTGGFDSQLGLVFYLVIIASSLRFGLSGSLLCAGTIALIYLGIGFADGGRLDAATANLFAERLFLFVVIALISGLLSRELVQSRARQLTHTYELEAVAFNELREVDRIKSDFMMLASHELRTPLTKIKAWVTLMQDAGDRLPASARDEGIRELRSESEHLARTHRQPARHRPARVRGDPAQDLVLRSGPGDQRDHLPLHRVRGPQPVRGQRPAGRQPGDGRRREAGPQPRLPGRQRAQVLPGIGAGDHRHPARRPLRPDRRAGRRTADPGGRGRPRLRLLLPGGVPLLRQRGGFGVGLYLARQLVERMGGKIWIDNSRVRGNTFVIALPGQI